MTAPKLLVMVVGPYSAPTQDARAANLLAINLAAAEVARRNHAPVIGAFARAWDPQPFHLDPEAARDSLFGRHVASGWHVASLMMRLFVARGWRLAGGIIGLQIDELVFRATPPGDSLRLVGEVIELKPSRSKPDRGLARVRLTMLNRRDEPALSCVATQVILRKSDA